MSGELIPFRRPSGSPNEISDKALLAASATGDSAALGVLFDRHGAAVSGFLALRAGTNRGDLEDLLHETFLTAQRRAGSYDERSAVRTWLIGIANNVARHYVRAEVRRKRLAHALAQHNLTVVRDEHASQDRRLALSAAVARLAPKLREAFVLVYQEGLSGADAAAVVGCRQGTIWKRLHQARTQLSSLLEDGDR